jgi:chromosome segregation ATPase
MQKLFHPAITPRAYCFALTPSSQSQTTNYKASIRTEYTEEIRTLRNQLDRQKVKTKTARARRKRERERRRVTEARLLEVDGQLETSRMMCVAHQTELNDMHRRQKVIKLQTAAFTSEFMAVHERSMQSRRAAEMLKVTSSTSALHVV